MEEAIDPHQPIIDAHHHLWDRPGDRYLIEELQADTAASHNIVQTVFVEASASYDTSAPPHLAPVGETRFVANQAAQALALGGSRIGAIVGHADLTQGAAVEEVLLAHVDAGNELFRGVRHGTNWSAYPDVKNGHHNPRPHQMAEPDFRMGVATLGELNLSFDAWLYFDQLREFADLARAVPQTAMILNHLGGPLGIGPHAAAGRLAMLETWQAGLAEAARCDNVVLKIGGIGMEYYFGTPWKGLPKPPSSTTVAAWWSEIVHRSIELFGPDRCMFESNYPVDGQTLPYSVLWNAFQILAQRYDPSEQQSLFHDTAARAYRLAPQ